MSLSQLLYRFSCPTVETCSERGKPTIKPRLRIDCTQLVTWEFYASLHDLYEAFNTSSLLCFGPYADSLLSCSGPFLYFHMYYMYYFLITGPISVNGWHGFFSTFMTKLWLVLMHAGAYSGGRSFRAIEVYQARTDRRWGRAAYQDMWTQQARREIGVFLVNLFLSNITWCLCITVSFLVYVVGLFDFCRFQ